MSDALEQIKGRLAAATPGPWYAHQNYIDMGVPDANHTITNNPADQYGGKYIADVGLHYDVKHGNSDLIAHAPTDLARLIKAVEAVEAACDRVIDNTDGHKPPGPPHPTREQATAVRIRAALSTALGGE